MVDVVVTQKTEVRGSGNISKVDSLSKTGSASSTDKPIYTQPAQQQQGGGGSNLGGFISNLFSSIFSTILQVASASFGGSVVAAVSGWLGIKGDKKA
jgi:hypothetical protein